MAEKKLSDISINDDEVKEDSSIKGAKKKSSPKDTKKKKKKDQFRLLNSHGQN